MQFHSFLVLKIYNYRTFLFTSSKAWCKNITSYNICHFIEIWHKWMKGLIYLVGIGRTGKTQGKETMKRPQKMLVRGLALGIALSLVAATQAAMLVGNNFGGVLYDINEATGAATNPRSTGIPNLVDVAFGPDGTLYGLTTVTSDSLYKFNPTTGTPTLVGSTGLSNIFEGDLAFQPGTGVLFGVQDVPSAHRLFTIDVTTGTATIVGNVSGSPGDLSGMAFAPNGTLYMLDTSAGSLLAVNPGTGNVLSSVSLSTHLGDVAGFEFDPVTGVAYVADGHTSGTGQLYTLNLATGGLTAVGPTGATDGLAGLAFNPVTAPEPASVGLLGGAMGLLALRRRRRKL
jgi:DNA-binding beta-propeller fold protein YncE